MSPEVGLDRKGGCLCGAVRFTARLTGTDFGVCHCAMCRKWTGSAFMGITVPVGNVTWSGKDRIAKRQTSSWAERAWCKDCGSGLFYRITVEGPMSENYEIPVGVLDDANGLDLVNEIYVDEKTDCFSYAGEGRNLLTRAEVHARFPMLTGKGD